MGKITGFMEFEASCRARRPVAERVNDWFEIYQDFPKRSCRHRAGAAWIVECLFVTRDVRSTTSFPIGTIWFIAGDGKKPFAGCMRQIIFRSLPDAFVLRLARLPVFGHQ